MKQKFFVVFLHPLTVLMIQKYFACRKLVAIFFLNPFPTYENIALVYCTMHLNTSDSPCVPAVAAPSVLEVGTVAGTQSRVSPAQILTRR